MNKKKCSICVRVGLRVSVVRIALGQENPTQVIRQERGSAEFLTNLFGSYGRISLSHSNTS